MVLVSGLRAHLTEWMSVSGEGLMDGKGLFRSFNLLPCDQLTWRQVILCRGREMFDNLNRQYCNPILAKLCAER